MGVSRSFREPLRRGYGTSFFTSTFYGGSSSGTSLNRNATGWQPSDPRSAGACSTRAIRSTSRRSSPAADASPLFNRFPTGTTRSTSQHKRSRLRLQLQRRQRRPPARCRRASEASWRSSSTWTARRYRLSRHQPVHRRLQPDGARLGVRVQARASWRARPAPRTRCGPRWPRARRAVPPACIVVRPRR